jgi:hypothetical protein
VPKSDNAWIDVKCIAMTRWPTGKKEPKAYLVYNGKTQVWIPAILVLDSDADLDVGVSTRIEMSQEIAEEKGLV